MIPIGTAFITLLSSRDARETVISETDPGQEAL
jgi:hypothetical protein